MDKGTTISKPWRWAVWILLSALFCWTPLQSQASLPLEADAACECHRSCCVVPSSPSAQTAPVTPLAAHNASERAESPVTSGSQSLPLPVHAGEVVSFARAATSSGPTVPLYVRFCTYLI